MSRRLYFSQVLKHSVENAWNSTGYRELAERCRELIAEYEAAGYGGCDKPDATKPDSHILLMRITDPLFEPRSGRSISSNVFEPSHAEIAEVTTDIRTGWDHHEEQKRRIGIQHAGVIDKPWTPPVVCCTMPNGGVR